MLSNDRSDVKAGVWMKKWPKIKLRTFLLLAIAACCLVIFSFVQRDNKLFSNGPEVPFNNTWIAFLYNIYGAIGIEFLHPMSIFADDLTGNVYIVNSEKHRIDVFDDNGSFQFSFGGFGVEKGKMSFPYGVARLPGGNLVVTESGNGRIQEFTTDGKSLGFLVDKNNNLGLQKPGPIRVDSLGKIYVGDLSAGKVFIFSKEGRLLKKIKDITYPHGIAIDEKRNRLYVASAATGEIKTYLLDEKNGSQAKKTSYANLGVIRGIDVDAKGNLYVVNSLQASVIVFDATGDPLTNFGTLGNENGQMLFPNGIDVTDKDRIYIADWGNNRVNVWEVRGF